MRVAGVFAHYDCDGIVDDYVFFYLKSLRKSLDSLIFVTTANLDDASIKKVRSLDIHVIQRPNEGYDFFSYKVGIHALSLDDYDELILCNDSVYGPFYDMQHLLTEMRAREGDFWGITESFDLTFHLQSYFLLFKRAILCSEVFRDFWASLEPLVDKREIIRRYEVGLTQLLIQRGYTPYSMTSVDDIGNFGRARKSWRQYLKTISRRWREPAFWSDVRALLLGKLDIGINPAHIDWRSLLENERVPFIKIELLRDNPKELGNLDTAFAIIRSLGDYPVELICTHLNRVGTGLDIGVTSRS